MKRPLLTIVGLSFMVLLTGAGCARYTGEQTPPPSATTTGENQKNNSGIPATPTEGTVVLTAEPGDTGIVKVKFTVADDVAKGAEGYRIVMGRTPNPTMDNATLWYQLGPDHKEKMWKTMVTGKRHVRVCVVKGDTCTVYSNNVEVEIK